MAQKNRKYFIEWEDIKLTYDGNTDTLSIDETGEVIEGVERECILSDYARQVERDNMSWGEMLTQIMY